MNFSVSISGFGSSEAQPVTILCLHDRETNVMVVGKAIDYKEERVIGKDGKEFALVTNLPLENRDFLFTSDHLRDAIRDYYTRSGQGLIDIDGDLARFRPDNKIERTGVDERGPKFELGPDVGNGEVAILAAVAFVSAQAPITIQADAMADFNELYKITQI